MLRPYTCVVCEKVLIAKDDVPSLISLFSKLIVTVPAGTKVPSNAVAPREWTVFSIWQTEPGDENREYMLCTQFLYPDKTQFADISRSKIKIEPNKRAQMLVQVPGFPIGQFGHYTIRTWIEESKHMVVGPIEFTVELEIVRQE